MTRWSATTRTRGRRSALAYGSRSTTAAEHNLNRLVHHQQGRYSARAGVAGTCRVVSGLRAEGVPVDEPASFLAARRRQLVEVELRLRGRVDAFDDKVLPTPRSSSATEVHRRAAPINQVWTGGVSGSDGHPGRVPFGSGDRPPYVERVRSLFWRRSAEEGAGGADGIAVLTPACVYSAGSTPGAIAIMLSVLLLPRGRENCAAYDLDHLSLRHLIVDELPRIVLSALASTAF